MCYDGSPRWLVSRYLFWSFLPYTATHCSTLQHIVYLLQKCCDGSPQWLASTYLFWSFLPCSGRSWAWSICPASDCVAACCSGIQRVGCIKVCCSVLQCVAVCCSHFLRAQGVVELNQYARHHTALQHVAVCCSVMQCIAACRLCCSLSQFVAVCCGELQCVAVCCNVLQCVAVISWAIMRWLRFVGSLKT